MDCVMLWYSMVSLAHSHLKGSSSSTMEPAGHKITTDVIKDPRLVETHAPVRTIWMQANAQLQFREGQVSWAYSKPPACSCNMVWFKDTIISISACNLGTNYSHSTCTWCVHGP